MPDRDGVADMLGELVREAVSVCEELPVTEDVCVSVPGTDGVKVMLDV